MGEAFKTTVKPDKTGKISACVICNVTPKEGDPLWMQNLGDETNKKWIVSPHEECFKKLQENPNLAKKSYPAKSAPRRTIEESLAFAKAFDDWAWKIAKAHAEELHKILASVPNDIEGQKQRAIATESIYHTLVEAFNG